MLNKIEDIKKLVSNATFKKLQGHNINSIDDFYEKCKIKNFWGKVSNNINKKDRVKLEKLLLENRVIDSYAYYPVRGSMGVEGKKPKDYLIKYISETNYDGNLKILDGVFITYEYICVDRLLRKVELCLKTNVNTEIKKKFDLTYWQSEDIFFELERKEIKSVSTMSERTHTLKIESLYVSGKKETFGPGEIITDKCDIEKLLFYVGIDMMKIRNELLKQSTHMVDLEE